jgi:archaellum component FlaF (FlaF/FlaG flagellin family)
MILIAVVIVLGFVAFAYARSTAGSYQTQYQENVSNDISKLKENLAFEYAHYNNSTKHLFIYFMNAGSINLQIDKVYVNSSLVIGFEVKYLSGGAANRTLGVGEQRLIDLSVPNLSGSNSVKITTIRGSNFAYTFMV